MGAKLPLSHYEKIRGEVLENRRQRKICGPKRKEQED
jgi:hypothetical protein